MAEALWLGACSAHRFEGMLITSGDAALDELPWAR